ncbi:H-2 class II histocompatibility antigen gamma chain [Trichoplax sp. H2]|uniref:Thyroglobulin type-1 domain-containing protein n=1 Tax=Trichoplax adhaerens TaxID=10228 RepID=B3SAD3_TRIAD|nr:expressed hypothetical protein [Trichoplax adhaerens]EDV20237.1 expressed hypothetical protein [Trichoplax adhaerens]RDD40256.1 H-2 class II histocompatibility antigen gamma chain [Trichoplax sp. H2]|eukprot:XP_002117187.1 expressed hypothetical protein [Trichoplax adhaerens]
MKLTLAIIAIIFCIGTVSAVKLPPCWAYLQEHASILEHGEPHMVGGYTPQCDEEGYYKLMQCSGSTGYCWCTTPIGLKVPETDRRPGHANGLDCKAEVAKYANSS